MLLSDPETAMSIPTTDPRRERAFIERLLAALAQPTRR